MLKKTITFEDLDGNPITEEFHFNLTKAEIAEMMFGKSGGLEDYLKRIIKEEDNEKLMELFKELLIKAVGKRGDDNRKFIKNRNIIDDFAQSDAYSELFVELATDAEQAIAFIKGIVPSAMQDAIADTNIENLSLPELSNSTPAAPAEPAWLTEGRTPTPDEIKKATPEQLRLAWQRKETDNATPPVA